MVSRPIWRPGSSRCFQVATSRRSPSPGSAALPRWGVRTSEYCGWRRAICQRFCVQPRVLLAGGAALSDVHWNWLSTINQMQAEGIEIRDRWVDRLLSRMSATGEVIADACEAHRFWLLSAASALYLIVVGLSAAQKQLENDELFTLYISRLPSMGEVWSALLTGAEQLPPFFYVLTRASLSLFGESQLTLRLPAVVGVWVMGLCLYRFVSKRSTALYGLIAMLFALTTNACYYAFEARPYGLILGFSGIALLCWQSFLEERR